MSFVFRLSLLPSAFALLLVSGTAASAQLFDTTPEFLVNSSTALNQAYPDAARIPGQGYVVVWESENHVTTGDDVYLRVVDSSGVPLGPELRVNQTLLGAQDSSAVAVHPDGQIMVAWEAAGQDGSQDAVIARLYDTSGVPLTNEFQLNAFTLLAQDSPALAPAGPGEFIAVWQSTAQDGSSGGIIGRMFRNDGLAVTGEFIVNTATLGSQSSPAVASDANGNFTVVWHSANQDGSAAGVYGQRFNALGNPLGTEFRVNTYTLGPQDEADIGMTATGEFVVAWESGSTLLPQDGSAAGAYGQRFAADGTPLGTEFRANEYTILNQDDVAVGVDPNSGEFLISWESVNQDGSDPGIYGQRYQADGLPIGSEFRINRTVANSQEDPSVIMDGNGSAVVVWQSDLQDGDLGGIYARAVCDQIDGDPALGFVCTEPLCNIDGTPCAAGGICCDGTCTLQSNCAVQPGDCNLSGGLDAGDPICVVLCLINNPPLVSDCTGGADCNCTGSIDAGDPVCTVLRLIDGLTTDSCIP